MFMRYESDVKAATPQTCNLCGRKHRHVVTFREVCLVVPEDPSQVVRLFDGEHIRCVGTSCAYTLLASVPSMLYTAAKNALDKINRR